MIEVVINRYLAGLLILWPCITALIYSTMPTSTFLDALAASMMALLLSVAWVVLVPAAVLGFTIKQVVNRA